jgi:membrane-bound metal-dependent hydrolase YbcI (DUF457 family)
LLNLILDWVKQLRQHGTIASGKEILILLIVHLIMTGRQFRILLIAAILVGIIGALIDLVIPSLVPESLLKAQELEDNSLLDAHLLSIGGTVIALLIASIAATVGLYRFRPWAPRFTLVTTALTLLLTPFLGAFTQSGVAVALMELSSMLWGAVLSVAYFSPLANRFKQIN